MKLILGIALLAACNSDKSTDTADAELNIEATDTGTDDPPCEISVRANGIPVEDLANPSVGDDWYLIMYCDDTILMGPAVLQIHPTHLATVDPENPILTFVETGDGEIRYQLGNRQSRIPVTIEE